MPRNRLSLFCVLTAITTATGARSDMPGVAGAVDPEPHPRQHHPVVRDGARPLPFFYDLYTFRGRGGSTAIVSAFAVEAGRLETEGREAGVRYRFSVTLILADTALRSVSNTHDTVYVDVRRPLSIDHLLYTHVEVLAPPSSTTRQRVIMIDATTPGIGQLYSEFFPIPDYSGNQLMLSDIALGQPETDAGWRRGDVTLALLPTSQLPTSAFDVYYEIYNLPAGHGYATEIGIESVADRRRAGDDDRNAPIRLRFSGESAAGPDEAVPELRRVETSLARGSYRITVTITDLNTGATASRSRDFEIRNRDRDVTMVAARPQSRPR